MTSGTDVGQAAESGRSVKEGGRRINRRSMVAVTAAALVVSAAGVGWACRASAGDGAGLTGAQGAAAASPEASLAQGAASQAKPAPVVTSLTPTGFTPHTLNHAAGRFDLKVRNQSGEKEVVLRLSNAAGERLWEVKLTDKVRDWTGPVEILPGTYTLSEAAHPAWTCRIEVSPQ